MKPENTVNMVRDPDLKDNSTLFIRLCFEGSGLDDGLGEKPLRIMKLESGGTHIVRTEPIVKSTHLPAHV